MISKHLLKLAPLLGNLPIIAPRGPLRALRWTLHPCTSYWRGMHEVDLVKMLRRRGPKPGDAVWDVGAHFGFYALWFARITGIHGEVAAFEPNPHAFAKLRLHARLNQFPYLKIFPFACGNHDGRGEMIDASGPVTTAHFRYHDEPDPSSTLSVEQRRLESVQVKSSLRDPDWIKIDVEGFAGPVLEGSMLILTRAKPSLLIATHSQVEVSAIRTLLEPLLYDPFNHCGVSVAWNNLQEGKDYFFHRPSC